MRLLATLGNVGILVLVVALWSTHGSPRDQGDWMIIIILIAAPIVNLVALYAGTGLKAPELLTLEVEARKAKLRKQINEANAKPAP